MSRVDAVLGAGAIAALGRRCSRGRLRVLAMHGVEDLTAFEQQLRQLTSWFEPVGADRVVQWFRGERGLPDRAMWLTFDDGEATTVVDAAPVLSRAGVPATVFVCPGLVETGRAPWWQVVERAGAAGEGIEVDGEHLVGVRAVRALKRRPDRERRELVSGLGERFGDDAARPVRIEDLQRWQEAGGDIGNHTWDHPCLDRCSPAEQQDQIDRAADWLDRHDLWRRRLFAYPNGDRTDVAEAHLRRGRYELVTLFDHHLVARGRGPLQVSRLRLDAGASPERTAAVSSGWHSGLFSLRSRVRAG